MKKFVSTHDYVPLSKHNEPGGGPYITQPDDSMTMRDIINRFSKGQDPSVHHPGTFVGDDDFDSPDLEKVSSMDLVDREEFSQQLSADILAKQEVFLTASEQKKAASAAAKLEAEKKAARLQRLLDKEDKRSADDDAAA